MASRRPEPWLRPRDSTAMALAGDVDDGTAGGGVVVGRDQVVLGLQCDGVARVDRPVRDLAGREPGDGAAGADAQVSGDHAGAGVGDGGACQDGEGRR